MNSCIMLGRLTRDPEIRYAKNENQTPVASFSIAVNRPTRKGEEKKTDFFRCVCFGWLAEFAEEHLCKGMRINVAGRLQNESYENKEGETVRYDQIILREIHFADGKMNDEDREELPQNAAGGNRNAGNRNNSGVRSRNGQQGGGFGKGKKNSGQGSGYQSRSRQQATDDAFMNDEVDEELPFN